MCVQFRGLATSPPGEEPKIPVVEGWAGSSASVDNGDEDETHTDPAEIRTSAGHPET